MTTKETISEQEIYYDKIFLKLNKKEGNFCNSILTINFGSISINKESIINKGNLTLKKNFPENSTLNAVYRTKYIIDDE